MNAAQLERLNEHLGRLRLVKSRERLEALLQDATAKELSYADFLDQLLSEEVASKTAKNVTMRTSLARFPFVKGLDQFDFGYQPSLDKKQVQNLASCHFIEHGENVVILGPPGVGKSHCETTGVSGHLAWAGPATNDPKESLERSSSTLRYSGPIPVVPSHGDPSSSEPTHLSRMRKCDGRDDANERLPVLL